jgi:branched-chain amino acid transport system ATP-binding protein
MCRTTPVYARLTLVENRQTFLKVADLSVSYGHIRALRNVNLTVNKSEFVCLIGANGAGKSTLIAAIIGLVHASNGNIHYRGENITHKSTESIVASGISVVPEGRGIFPLMTVMENLQLGAFHIKGNLATHFEQVFERFPILSQRKSQLAGTLSGGEQQMLAIGRGLMGDPAILIMDEPSLGLAPLAVTELFNILNKLKSGGQTILLSEQNARKALQFADRAYVFEVGQVVLEGNPQDIMNNPRIREAYLGATI